MTPTTPADFVVAIPARYASTRLPGKPLQRIGDRPMIQHVAERALLAGARGGRGGHPAPLDAGGGRLFSGGEGGMTGGARLSCYTPLGGCGRQVGQGGPTPSGPPTA
ncbi:cytidylyltransferase domain-containing protein, partial [Xanthomonas perforans]|uniref:cytidylyltransferase domain-containing protein n=1 Tax=Xanthomonas perforans TaxID=442694 RepID=UPI003D087229